MSTKSDPKADRKRPVRVAEAQNEKRGLELLQVSEHLLTTLKGAWLDIQGSSEDPASGLDLDQALQLDGDDIAWASDGSRYHFRYFDDASGSSWDFALTWNQCAEVVDGSAPTIMAMRDSFGERSPIPG